MCNLLCIYIYVCLYFYFIIFNKYSLKRIFLSDSGAEVFISYCFPKLIKLRKAWREEEKEFWSCLLLLVLDRERWTWWVESRSRKCLWIPWSGVKRRPLSDVSLSLSLCLMGQHDPAVMMENHHKPQSALCRGSESFRFDLERGKNAYLKHVFQHSLTDSICSGLSPPSSSALTHHQHVRDVLGAKHHTHMVYSLSCIIGLGLFLIQHSIVEIHQWGTEATWWINRRTFQ